MTLCGRPTKSGAPCRIPLRGGKCVTHDSNLPVRNRAVAQAFKESNPEGFARQRSLAGKRGFAATGGMHGWRKAHEKARQWRVENPSEPERWMIEVLADAGFTDYEREFPLDDGYSFDFVFDGWVAIEVNGHQHKPSFGEDCPRLQKQQRKIIRFERAGGDILVVDATGNREEAARDVVAFLKPRLR